MDFPVQLTDFMTATGGSEYDSTSIKQVTDDTTAIPTCQDTIAPILRLSYDLLIEIFLELHYDDESSCENIGGAGYRCHSDKWLSITWVCRLWRDVALQTPLLWTRITVGETSLAHSERNHVFLQRAQGYPLLLGLSDDLVWCKDLDPIVLAECHRWRHISGLRLGKKLVQTLALQRGLQMPMLEFLDVSFDDLEEGGTPTCYTTAFADAYMPRLERLKCFECPWDLVTTLVRPTLTALRIDSGLRLRYTNTTHLEWIKLLQNLPLLEELQITRCVPVDTPKKPEPTSHLAILPKLRTISMSWCEAHHIPAYTYLLLHIVSPWDTCIKITKESDIVPSSQIPDYRFALSCLSLRMSILSEHHTLPRPELHAVKIAHHKPNWPKSRTSPVVLRVFVNTRAKKWPVIHLELSQSLQATAGRDDGIERMFKYMCSTALLRSGLKSLKLKGAVGTYSTTWLQIARSNYLATLDHLHISSAASLSAFLQASDQMSSSSGYLDVLPHLNILSYPRSTFNKLPRPDGTTAEALLQVLVNTLERRRKQDIGPDILELKDGYMDVDELLPPIEADEEDEDASPDDEPPITEANKNS